jgi:hypothetical protein
MEESNHCWAKTIPSRSSARRGSALFNVFGICQDGPDLDLRSLFGQFFGLACFIRKCALHRSYRFGRMAFACHGNLWLGRFTRRRNCGPPDQKSGCPPLGFYARKLTVSVCPNSRRQIKRNNLVRLTCAGMLRRGYLRELVEFELLAYSLISGPSRLTPKNSPYKTPMI